MAVTFLAISNYQANQLFTGPVVVMPAGQQVAYVFINPPSQGEWLSYPADYVMNIVLQRSENNGVTWYDWDWDTFTGGDKVATDGSGRLPFIARGENTPLTEPTWLRCTFRHNQRRRMGLSGDFGVGF